jgi:hypothetical protein
MTNESRLRNWTVTGFVAAGLLIATAVMAGDAPAAKTKKPTGYAAVPWGATEKQLREALNLKDEWDCMDLHDVRHCTTSFVLGDYSVSVDLDLIDERFGRVIMTFPTSEFGLMKTTFIEKYGSPNSFSAPPVRTRMNVAYRNNVLRWEWDGVDATLERFGESVERGRASITTREFREALGTLDERAKRRAKDAPF